MLLLGVGGLLCYKFYAANRARICTGLRAYLYPMNFTADMTNDDEIWDEMEEVRLCVCVLFGREIVTSKRRVIWTCSTCRSTNSKEGVYTSLFTPACNNNKVVVLLKLVSYLLFLVD